MSLIEKPLLTTCPEKVCAACGMPWKRRPADRIARPVRLGELVPRCECRAEAEPGVVLDPFMGAGTSALAAELHGRRWIGIELNPVYVELAKQRLAVWRARKEPGHS